MKKSYDSPKMEIEYFRIANRVICDTSPQDVPPTTLPFDPDVETDF